MIGLCSKTYIARKGEEVKFSSKGVGKRHVQKPMEIFSTVLSTRQPASGINIGFRSRENGIYTYRQERTGFSYFYCKRRVLDDGIHTVPLDIVLCPRKPNPEEVILTSSQPSDRELVDILNSLSSD